MEPTIKEVLEMVGSIGGPAAAVIISMKYAINGMRSDVTEIKTDVKEIKGKQAEHAVQLAVLQARNDFQDSVDS